MATEVFNRIGEAEIHEENPRFRREKEDNYRNEKIESFSKPTKISEAKKEFLKYLEEDSLTVDDCSNINRDWKRKSH